MMSDKLHAKSNKCFFVGYPRETKGYNLYLGRRQSVCRPEWCFSRKCVLFKKGSINNVQFEEVQDASESVSEPAKSQSDMQAVAEPDVDAPTPRRSSRVSPAPE